jgi:hypothetical protein
MQHCCNNFNGIDAAVANELDKSAVHTSGKLTLCDDMVSLIARNRCGVMKFNRRCIESNNRQDFTNSETSITSRVNSQQGVFKITYLKQF